MLLALFVVFVALLVVSALPLGGSAELEVLLITLLVAAFVGAVVGVFERTLVSVFVRAKVGVFGLFCFFGCDRRSKIGNFAFKMAFGLVGFFFSSFEASSNLTSGGFSRFGFLTFFQDLLNSRHLF